MCVPVVIPNKRTVLLSVSESVSGHVPWFSLPASAACFHVNYRLWYRQYAQQVDFGAGCKVSNGPSIVLGQHKTMTDGVES